MILKPIKIGKTEIHIWAILLFTAGLLFDFVQTLLIVYAITAIHELAHIFTAKLCNVDIDGVEILPFGITMRIAKNCITNTSDEIKIALAGPISNLLIAYFVYGFYKGPYRDYIVTLRGVGYKFEFEN